MQFNTDKTSGHELSAWRQFLARSTLWLGVLLLGSAVICGVAANWQEMSKMQRFAGTQGLLIVSTLVAVWTQIRLRADGTTRYGIPGALLALAGVILGALLALVGQTYQTGADTWELFAAWALLLLPWALLAGSQVVWLMWVLVFNLASVLWLYDRVPSWWSMGALSLPALGINLLLLIGWEWAVHRWRASAMFGPRILTALIIAGLMLDTFSSGAIWTFKNGIWLAATLGLGYYYLKLRRDLLILAILGLGCVSMSLFMAVEILERMGGFQAWMFILLVLLVLAEAGWIAHTLRRLAAESHVVAPKATDPVGDGSPWYVHALLGLAAWLATLLLLAFLIFMSLVTSEQSALIAGLILCVAGIALLRFPASPFLHQCGTALAFSGQLLLSYSLLAQSPQALQWMTVLLIATAMYAIGSNLISRFLHGLLIAFAIAGLITLWTLDSNVFDNWQMDATWRSQFPLLISIVAGAWGTAAIFLLSWYRDNRWTRALQPLAWAFLLSSHGMVRFVGGVSMQELLQLWQLDPRSATLMVMGTLLPAVVAFLLLWPRRTVLTSGMLWGVPLALLVLACFWLPSPGVAYALAWVILGFGLNRRLLLLFGVFSLLAYLGLYYYQLQVTLLDKAIWLGGAACILFLLRVLIGLMPRLQHRQEMPSRSALPPLSGALRWKTVMILASLIVILVAVNGNIWQREKLLANGKVLVLELAPVDPRSLMQGDYMALDFAVARDAQPWEYQAESEQGVWSPGSDNKDGYAMLKPDADGVGRLLRFQQENQPRAEDEIALRFRVRNGKVRVVTNAYFFPEGQAERYAVARYGELRVAENGEALLARMLDQDLKPL